MRDLYDGYTIKRVEFTSSTNIKYHNMFEGSIGFLYYKEGASARFIEYDIGIPKGYLWTSVVQEVKFEGNLIILITLNSIYTFTLIEEEADEQSIVM